MYLSIDKLKYKKNRAREAEFVSPQALLVPELLFSTSPSLGHYEHRYRYVWWKQLGSRRRNWKCKCLGIARTLNPIRTSSCSLGS